MSLSEADRSRRDAIPGPGIRVQSGHAGATVVLFAAAIGLFAVGVSDAVRTRLTQLEVMVLQAGKTLHGTIAPAETLALTLADHVATGITDVWAEPSPLLAAMQTIPTGYDVLSEPAAIEMESQVGTLVGRLDNRLEDGALRREVSAVLTSTNLMVAIRARMPAVRYVRYISRQSFIYVLPYIDPTVVGFHPVMGQPLAAWSARTEAGPLALSDIRWAGPQPGPIDGRQTFRVGAPVRDFAGRLAGAVFLDLSVGEVAAQMAVHRAGPGRLDLFGPGGRVPLDRGTTQPATTGLARDDGLAKNRFHWHEGQLAYLHPVAVGADGSDWTLAYSVGPTALAIDLAPAVLPHLGLGILLLVAGITVLHRRFLQHRLHEAEARYREIFESSDVVQMLLSPDTGAIATANPAAARFFGVDRQALVGRPVLRSPDAFVRRQLSRFTLPHDPPAGKRRILDAWSTPIQVSGTTLLHVVATDITEQERQRHELEARDKDLAARNAAFEALGAVSPVGAILIDVAGRVILANARAAAFLDIDPARLRAMTVADLQGRVLEVAPAAHLTRAPFACELRDGGGAQQSTIQLRSGQVLEVHMADLPGDGRNDTAWFLLDVTDRAQREQTLRLQRDEIEAQARRLAGIASDLMAARNDAERTRMAAEMSSRAKSEFLATMSHELRTPLNAVLGFSQIIKEEMFGPAGCAQYIEYAEGIHASGSHLLTLLGDILELAELEAGRHDLQPVWLAPDEVLAAVMRVVRGRAMNAGITLSAVPAAERVPFLYADDRAYRQILLNLLINAIKFTPEGGRVTVRTATENGSLVVRISDTGIGIPAGEINRMLEPFEQADSAYTRNIDKGLGLGLPLAHALVRLHGGTLSIDSEIGRGTTVMIRFPPDRLAECPTAA